MKRPFSARPRYCALPNRFDAEKCQTRLKLIESKSTKTESGCWLYPFVRNFLDPYCDVVGDCGNRQQWTMRRNVWCLTRGDIPEGGIVVRQCKNRSCVAPEHIALWHQTDWVGFGSSINDESGGVDSDTHVRVGSRLATYPQPHDKVASSRKAKSESRCNSGPDSPPTPPPSWGIPQNGGGAGTSIGSQP